jgi:hypothetical protein
MSATATSIITRAGVIVGKRKKGGRLGALTLAVVAAVEVNERLAAAAAAEAAAIHGGGLSRAESDPQPGFE